MSELLRAICEACRVEVDPDDPDVIRAARQVEVSGFSKSGGPEYADGGVAFFHRNHFRPGRQWRQLADDDLTPRGA